MLETLAMMASSELDIPAERLGIRLTNPTSAEALAASENSLTRIAARQNRFFSRQLTNALSMAIWLREGSKPDLTGVRPVFAPVKESSDAAKADYYSKIAGANPDFADSDVGLSKAGLTFDELQSFRAYQQRMQASRRVSELRNSVLNEEAGDGSERPALDSATATGAPATS
jgi:hypothetical protein